MGNLVISSASTVRSVQDSLVLVTRLSMAELIVFVYVSPFVSSCIICNKKIAQTGQAEPPAKRLKKIRISYGTLDV